MPFGGPIAKRLEEIELLRGNPALMAGNAPASKDPVKT